MIAVVPVIDLVLGALAFAVIVLVALHVFTNGDKR